MQDIRKTQDKAKKNPIGGHFDYGRQGTSTTHILQQILSKLEESYFTFFNTYRFWSCISCNF
jgi:cystathionine beta-lyase